MASEEELKSEIERLRAENEALKKPAGGRMYLKVSEKGELSVYGMGRFPVTLVRLRCRAEGKTGIPVAGNAPATRNHRTETPCCLF